MGFEKMFLSELWYVLFQFTLRSQHRGFKHTKYNLISINSYEFVLFYAILDMLLAEVTKCLYVFHFVRKVS